MPKFIPDPLAGIESVQDLIAYLDRQLEKVSIEMGKAQDKELEELHAPPAKPRNYMVAAADGVHWNPGSGRGVYIYLGGRWNLISLVGVDNPGGGGGTPVGTADLTSLTPSSATIVEGASQAMTVSIDEVVSSNTVVALSSNDPAVLTVPSTVTIPAGQTQAGFTAQSVASGQATVTATLNTIQLQSLITVTAVSGDNAVDHISWEDGVAQARTYFEPHVAGTRQEVVDASAVPGGSVADGTKAHRTWTQSGDFVKSTTWHRAEYFVGGPFQVGETGTPAGEEYWMALSVLFPDTFHFPTVNGANTLWGQHHSTISTGQPVTAFEIAATNRNGVVKPHFRYRQYGVSVDNEIGRVHPFGHAYTPERNIWYDLTLRVIWKPNSDGLTEMWLRKRSETTARKWVSFLTHANMYSGAGIYFKFGKYHPPPPTGVQSDTYNLGKSFYPQSSVYHDRLVIGKTRDSVLFPGCTLDTVLTSLP